MATEFHLPDVGEGLTEASILEWFVDVGEPVDMDGPLVEVETDKAVVEIPAPVAGVLLHQGAPSGSVLAVDALLAVIGVAGERWEPGTVAASGGDAAPIVGSLQEATEVIPVRSGAGPAMLPMVRKLADELGVAPETLVGSGPGGRITEDDVRAAAVATSGEVRRVPMTGIRRTVAEQVTRSWREIPHVTIFDAADAGPMLAMRSQMAVRPPLEALVVSRIAPLLVEFPALNASVVGNEIVEKLHYDIGVAVDTPNGLVIAVVRDALDHDLLALAGEISRLAAAAKERTAKVTELTGQTFTISNIGAVGGGYGAPIVPYGTTAILSFGKATPTPVVRDGEIVAATMMPLSLSYDHRAIDGATGRSFMAAVVAALEA